jgi:hypothetical protein
VRGGVAVLDVGGLGIGNGRRRSSADSGASSNNGGGGGGRLGDGGVEMRL